MRAPTPTPPACPDTAVEAGRRLGDARWPLGLSLFGGAGRSLQGGRRLHLQSQARLDFLGGARPRLRGGARLRLRGGARLGLTLALAVLFVGGGLVGLARVRPELVDRVWQRLTVPESPRRPDAADPEPGELAEGWVRVHVGGPSEVQEPGPGRAGGGEDGFPDFVLVVQPGQTLRGIAAEHYRRSDVRLLEALARYNGMDDPNDLPAGAELRLPDIEAFEGL